MATAAQAAALAVPSLARRLACLVYEGVLLTGIVMIAGLVYAGVTDQRHALQGTPGLRLWIFVVCAAYFVWLWSHGGQTLAMKTWRLRVVTAQGVAPGVARAFTRYLFGWLWFLPALAFVDFTGLRGGWPTVAAVATGMLGYAMLAWLHPSRRLPHEWISGTRLVSEPR